MMLTLYLASAFIITIFLVQRLRAPIANIPGPWYTKFTSLILKYHEFTSNRRLYIHALHLKYGSAVRIAPNEASFAGLDAIREIYASGGSGYDKTELYDLFRQFGIKYGDLVSHIAIRDELTILGLCSRLLRNMR
jgi:hypothetical protein